MSLDLENRAARALSAAASDLMIAACELGLANKPLEALVANEAAKRALETTTEICDAILARWWVRLIVCVGDFITGRRA